jgi:hypothetical protein
MINIHRFNEQFRKEYSFLYDHNDNVAGYREAVNAFDEFIKDPALARFVQEFAAWRKDPITSDREAAAFMFALETIA